jgi:transcriptional regulator with XRE-family HTH domain
VSSPTPPPLRRRHVGKALRRLREDAGFDMAEARKRAGMSESKISRAENALVAITGDTVRTLCEAYGVDRETTDALAELARQSNKRGPWHVYEDHALGKLIDYVQLETDARTLKDFQIDLIPGLLQTVKYAEAIVRADACDPTDEEVVQRVEVRMDRQARSRARSTDLWVVVGEAALHHPVGGYLAMADQLEHLASRAGEPKTRVQVLPLNAPAHAGMGTPFTLLDLDWSVTYGWLDIRSGGMYIEDEAEIRRYSDTWRLVTATALDLTASVAVIKRIADEHRSKA